MSPFAEKQKNSLEINSKNHITEFHNSILAGHKGSHKMYRKIVMRFYWRYLRSYVEEYDKRCQDSQLEKTSSHKKKT